MPSGIGNAKDFATTSWSGFPNSWQRLQGVQAQKGDIIIYGCNSGPGHIAVYESDYVTYHQNYSATHVERIDNVYYKNAKSKCCYYWGVIRPDFKSVDRTPPNITSYRVEMANSVQSTMYMIKVKAECPTGISVVKFPTRVNGGDFKWFNGTYNNNEKCWMFVVNKADFGNVDGMYETHIYAYAGCGEDVFTCKTLAPIAMGPTVVNVGNFTARIALKTNNNYVIGIDGTSSGSNVSLKDKNATDKNQLWKFTNDGKTNCYTIINVATGKSLDVNGGCDENGTNVQIYNNINSDAQRFYIMNYNGGYRIVPKTSLDMKAIDNSGNTLKNGNNILLYQADNTNNWSQTWVFEKVANSISLNKATVSLNVGGTASLTATISPSDAYLKNVSWSSSNSSIATVSSSGVVTAKSAGTATITATAQDGSGVKATCVVTVTKPAIPVTGVKLDKTEVLLTSRDQTIKLNATITPSNATNKELEWHSTNSPTAIVDQNGVVKALANGTTTIQVWPVGGDGYAECIVKVAIGYSDITGVTLNKTTVKLTSKGQIMQLTATVNPTNAYSKKVNWSSSNTKVATVDSTGKVTAIANGSATITATSDAVPSKKATCVITVSISKPVEEKLPFNDVPTNSWFYEAVKYNYKNNIIKGYQDGTFKPGNNITRGQLVTILWRMENEPKVNTNIPFNDVNGGAYYANAIKWASNKKIVNGYDDGAFRPDNQITRQQLAVILCNYAKYKGKNVTANISINNYKDNGNVAGYATSSIKWAIKNGVMSGKDQGTKIDPTGTASRCECAAMIYNYCMKIK